MFTTLKSFTKDIGLLTIALTLALMANFTYGAWNNPTANPVGGNTAVPINESGISQVKQGPLSTGVLSVIGNLGLTSGDVRITATQPTIKYFDSDANAIDFWTRVDNNKFYIFADRDDNGGWNNDGAAPLELNTSSATDGSGDYARFAGQVRANQYCDAQGGNCAPPGGSSFEEVDPQVGVLIAGQGCRANNDGSGITCDYSAPTIQSGVAPVPPSSGRSNYTVTFPEQFATTPTVTITPMWVNNNGSESTQFWVTV